MIIQITGPIISVSNCHKISANVAAILTPQSNLCSCCVVVRMCNLCCMSILALLRFSMQSAAAPENQLKLSLLVLFSFIRTTDLLLLLQNSSSLYTYFSAVLSHLHSLLVVAA